MTQGKILIVDDCSMNIELMQETLANFDYEIVSYSNPFEALEKERDSKIDLLLLDVVMPGLDGFKFTEEFIKTHNNTPVVFVSAHGASENKIKGYNLGSYVYIEKPFEIKTLRAQIHSILHLKQVQDELLKEKEKLDNIFEFTSNEMILTDVNFNIVSQNNKILKKEKYNSKNLLEIFSLTEDNDYIEEIEEFAFSEKSHLQFRIVFENNLYTKTTISKISPNNSLSGYLVIMEDMSEEIEKQNMRSHFIEMLTHDLKTPVRAEKRALELLIEGSFGELNTEQFEIIQEILNSSRYMLNMTDNILTRYKIDSGEFKIKKSSNSIKSTLEFCVDSLKYRYKAKEQKIKINSSLKDKDCDVFDYDEVEIRRVLTNIISNASDYAPVGTEINISLNKKADNIEISIKDQGPGLSKEQISDLLEERRYITQRFKKVGSGLGLYITKKIIEAHNGKLKIETDSKKHTGTIFTLYLPYKKTKKLNLIHI